MGSGLLQCVFVFVFVCFVVADLSGGGGCGGGLS